MAVVLPPVHVPTFQAGLGRSAGASLSLNWHRDRRQEALESFQSFLPHWWFGLTPTSIVTSR